MGVAADVCGPFAVPSQSPRWLGAIGSRQQTLGVVDAAIRLKRCKVRPNCARAAPMARFEFARHERARADSR